MNPIRFAIEQPVTVVVGVLFTLMFGLIGLNQMPYQLSPTVVKPEITVRTNWAGATPYEIEREVIEEQEKVLKAIPRLESLESSSFNGLGEITLKFSIGTDIDNALLRVSNKLNEVRSYPENVDRPVINASGASASPVIWMVMKATEDNPRPINTYGSFFENEVRQFLERIEGVSDLFFFGGTENQLHIKVQAERLAAYGLTIQHVMQALQSENVNVSAGNLGVGRKDYRIRTVAEFKNAADVENVVLRSTGQQRVLLRDVADVEFGTEKLRNAMMQNGHAGMAVGVRPVPGTNILDLTNKVEAVVQELNETRLKPNGVYLDWVYDQRGYINGAIELVKQNILYGGILAVIILLIFLRSILSTVVVGTSIPISIIGTFFFMNLLDRNLNVVSLAGISFAVGMLVDSAIVVLENIDRHRKLGKSAMDAAFDGTSEVWGAILASALTTVAVFLPVAFIEEEAGQLFRDISIAVAFAVMLSLVVSVLVIPMLSKQLFSLTKELDPEYESIFDRIGTRIADLFMFFVRLAVANWFSRFATVILFSTASIYIAYLLMPKMEYLPEGNRNFIINILIPPPGLSYEERLAIGEYLFEQAGPHIGQEKDGMPAIKHMFYVGAERIMLTGLVSADENRVREFIPMFQRLIFSIPGMFGISKQASIFESGLGQGRSIDVDISGNDLNALLTAAGPMYGMLMQAIPGSQIRPIPSIEATYPEIRIEPDRDRLKASGMSSRELAVTMDVILDGRTIGEFKEEGKNKIDMVLRTHDEAIDTPEDMERVLLALNNGRVVPVNELAQFKQTTGITEIRHLERRRTVTMQVTPPASMPVEEAMELIENDVLAKMKQAQMLSGLDVRLSGTADKLTTTRQALQWNFLLAAVIIYFLMAAMFANFIYPLVIILTVPLATAGGFIGLKLVNLTGTPQPLDVLTMLGFIILVGIVVNNAILIVHQSLNNLRYEGLPPMEAVLQATRTRLRPIYMSTATSVFGMLPLVIFPGPGSELYKGLGAVVLGGLVMSTLLTVFMSPALLIIFLRLFHVGEDRS